MESRRASQLGPVAIALGFIVLAAALLGLMGGNAICPCGYVKLWHGEVPSAESSQHLLDWWTFSHVIHGFLFYAALWWAAPRLGPGWRFLLATLGEIGWEILENSTWVIERYRTMTVAVGYNGDSILNAMSDIAAMSAGFALARLLPVRLSVAIVVAIEALPMFVIRDGLLMNVVSLLWPVPALIAWQAGA